MSNNKKIFKQIYAESMNILQSVKASLHKKTRQNYFSKLENVSHLATLKKINRELQTFQKIKTETPKINNKISTKITAAVMKAAKPAYVPPVKPKVAKEYFVTASVKLKFEFTTKQKAGNRHIYDETKPFAKKITAYSEEEAIKQFEENINQEFIVMSTGEDSRHHKSVSVDSYHNMEVNSFSGMQANQEATIFMKSAKPLKYEFIPSTDRLNKNNGFCVSDVILGVYAKHIPTLNLQRFTDLCLKVRYKNCGSYEDYLATQKWSLDQGVTPEMLCEICKILDISHYSYDITNKCFLKFVCSKNRNYPALVYYCVNGHMYHVEKKDAALKLAMSAKSIEHKIKSNLLDEEMGAKTNKYATKTIVENVDISNLSQDEYKGTICIYAKTNLNEELDMIIEKYNYIPEIKNKKFVVTEIYFNLNETQDMILTIDPNISGHSMTWKDVKILCEKNNIEFKNQSFAGLIKQLQDKFFNSESIRHKFTPAERLKLYNDLNKKCSTCEKDLKINNFHLDHIIPLSRRGTNEIENLQILCKPCHFEKTRQEQNDQYVKQSATESSVNLTTKQIFNSDLTHRYAFVEKLTDKEIDQKKYFIDINRCRKNILYSSKYDYPLFTVMDEPVIYKGKKRPGLYFVETKQYVPMRGNGWYSQPMIEYCLSKGLIYECNIKYALYSSLTIPSNYYVKFIDYLYDSLDNRAKLSVNTFIGALKPKVRETWKSKFINTDPNVVLYHSLKLDGAFIHTKDIADKYYYQLFDVYTTEKNETEAPLYNQILDLEAIEVHRLISEIEKRGGQCLSVRTDCVECVFPDNIFPFYHDPKDENKNLIGFLDTHKYNVPDDIYRVRALPDSFYWDKECKLPKYKLEDKCEGKTNIIEKLPKYVRTGTYDFKLPIYNIISDVSDNNFNPLVESILASGKSIHIDGRAGCGKSTLIKLLQHSMTVANKKYISLAPTNKACRIIDGITCHKFVSTHTCSIRTMDYKYIFIDEVSMMSEAFYKYFLLVKSIRPDILFIVSGDFGQLLPVGDRLDDANYKDSLALNELVDGNRLILSKCRRSDDKLYNMLLPDNINYLKKQDFGNNTSNINICFTNKKRIEVNDTKMKLAIKNSHLKSSKILKLDKLDYDDNSQYVELVAGMPIIARKNSKQFNICNNETFKIHEVRHKTNTIAIKDEFGDNEPITIGFDQFQHMFYLAYCITTHKSQGMTIDQPYCIHEFEKFDERMKYVALSRSTDILNINIV
jgi:hypothetical protein